MVKPKGLAQDYKSRILPGLTIAAGPTTQRIRDIPLTSTTGPQLIHPLFSSNFKFPCWDAASTLKFTGGKGPVLHLRDIISRAYPSLSKEELFSIAGLKGIAVPTLTDHKVDLIIHRSMPSAKRLTECAVAHKGAYGFLIFSLLTGFSVWWSLVPELQHAIPQRSCSPHLARGVSP